MRVLPEKGDEFVIRQLFPDSMYTTNLPPYGYIDRIEIRPINDTLNCDAARPLRFRWQLLDSDGREIECQVQLVSRSIKAAQ